MTVHDRLAPRTAALAIAGLFACGTPEPADSATTGSGSTAGQTEGSSESSTGSGATTDSGSTGTSGSATTPTSGTSEGPTSSSGDPSSSGDLTSTTDGTTGTVTETSTETGGVEPSFTKVYEQILVAKNCTSPYCHGSGAGGLELTDEGTSYANLVEIAATLSVCGLSVRVLPDAPEQSILWRRVRPAAQDMGDMCAPKMPQGTMGLADAEAQLVYDWIAAGAPE